MIIKYFTHTFLIDIPYPIKKAKNLKYFSEKIISESVLNESTLIVSYNFLGISVMGLVKHSF